MSSRIDGSNQIKPIADQSQLEGSELTPEKQQQADQFRQETSRASEILNQPVQKGDMDAARARVNDLQQHFQSLSPESKQKMYDSLTREEVPGAIKGTFEYKLSTPSREKLLKTLNPDHVSPKQLTQAEVDKARASKTGEKNLEGKLQQAELLKAFDQQQSPGAVKMPTFGTGPGAVKMPTFGPDEGPGAVRMPRPKIADDAKTSHLPGATKMPQFEQKEGPGSVRMPEPKVTDQSGLPNFPEATKMPTFGTGPGAVKMPTFGPDEGPGAVRMPQPKISDDAKTSHLPGATKMPQFEQKEGPESVRMPQSKVTDQSGLPNFPEATKMPTFGTGPGAVKMPTFGPDEGPGAVRMPQPKIADEAKTSHLPGATKMPQFEQSEGPGATRMPEPGSTKDSIPRIVTDEEAFRKLLKGDKE